ncbi:11538_t:CDS:2 [Funneliformis mosseae]|uniref:11538_t:CDS:1 n=1 Tax=Funneliformis mosseae TaxID=27381 RepID=A0A9N9AXQ3_FUNMO|nr:11538_t:CDS:2 [Funneliformis mosseae]
MTLFGKLYNQVRPLLFVREVCYNDGLRKQILYSINTKVQLSFLKRTMYTRDEIDNFTDHERFIEETEDSRESENFSTIDEIVDDTIDTLDIIPDKDELIKNPPIVRRNKHWSRLEVKVLESLIEKYGKDWETISQHMFEKTPQECEAQYEDMMKGRPDLRQPLKGLPDFTESEIAQINNLIEENGRSWRKIAKHFYGKSALAVESFVKNNPNRFPSLYKRSIIMKQFKGSAWTDEELKSLNELIVKYGRDYDAISEELPGRSPKAIERSISKHMLDLPALHSGKVADWFRSSTIWSESETRLLNELVETYGFNWEKISEYLPGRSPISCSAKFYGSWSTWNTKVTALVPHKWPKEVLQFLDLLIERYGRWQIIPLLIPGITPANWFSPFYPQSRVWTTSEKVILQYLVRTLGYNWEKISEYFPHRQRWSIIREVLGNIEYYESVNANENDLITKLAVPKKQKRRSSLWPYDEVKKLYELKERYSSNWYKISGELPGRTPAACYLKDFVLTNACHWTEKEEALFKNLIASHGNNWKFIKNFFPRKSYKQLYEYYQANRETFPDAYSMNTNYWVFNRSSWKKEENDSLKELITKHHGDFDLISRNLPGRTSAAIKAHIRNHPELFSSKPGIEQNRQSKEICKKGQKVQKDQKGSNIYWTTEDENKLLELVNSHPVDWSKIAAEFPSRSLSACKTKYRSLLKPEMTISRFIDTYKVS